MVEVATASASDRKSAHVVQSTAATMVNASLTISCESNGAPLKVCLWKHNVDGQHEIIAVDGIGVIAGKTHAGKIPASGQELQHGTCSLRIESVVNTDLGTWLCTLLDDTGAVFAGKVEVSEATAALVNGGANNPAHVPISNVTAKADTWVVLTCESGGVPLSSCVWRPPAKGDGEGIVIYGNVVPTGGHGQVDRISTFSDELQNGGCCIGIQSMMYEDFGVWSCLLIGQTGAVWTGIVQVQAEEQTERMIYAATRGGLFSYSLATSEMKMVGNISNYTLVVTYDPVQDQLYWGDGYSNIYRGNRNGTQVEVVFSTRNSYHVSHMDFDWIAGNLYFSLGQSDIYVCHARQVPDLACFIVVETQGDVGGIALHPTEGVMLWTTRFSGKVKRAGMDGSYQSTFVEGLNRPDKITIDFQNSRLYWVSWGDHKIQSSNLQGYDVRTVVQRPSDSSPMGIALLGERLYWCTNHAKTLESSTKAGEDLRLLYTGTDNGLYDVAVVPRPDLPMNRKNDCENQTCSKLCVLTWNSFRCLK